MVVMRNAIVIYQMMDILHIRKSIAVDVSVVNIEIQIIV